MRVPDKVRFLNALVYALFAAMGAALLAPPLLQSADALVRRYSYLPDLTLPWLWLGFAAALFVALTGVARRILARQRVGLVRYAVLLALVGLIGAARKVVSPPARPSVDDALANAVARVENTAVQQWERNERYPLDASVLERDLPGVVRDLGFRQRGAFALRGRVVVVANAQGPVFIAPDDVNPGDTVFAVSPDAQAYWITAFELGATDRPTPHTGRGGRVLVASGRAGRASSRLDPLFPDYPNKSRVKGPAEPGSR